ncbi:MAG: glycosyltransferase [Spirochaetia bacterium]
MSVGPGLIVIMGFAAVALVIVGILAAMHLRRKRRRGIVLWFRRFIAEGVPSATRRSISETISRRPLEFLQAYSWYCDTVTLSDATVEKLEGAFVDAEIDLIFMRRLTRRRARDRVHAALYLGYIRSERSARALLHALEHEPLAYVRLRMVYSLVRIGTSGAIPTIVDTLLSMPEAYQDRVRSLLLEFGDGLLEILPYIINRTQPQVQRLVIDVAARYPTPDLRAAIEGIVEAGEPELSRSAFRVFAEQYGSAVELERYLDSPDSYVRNIAVESLGRSPSLETIELIRPYLVDDETHKSAVVALSEVSRRNPRLYPHIVEHLRNETNEQMRSGLAEALAPRVEYLLQSAIDEQWSDAADLLGLLLKTHKATGVLSYLNRSGDRGVIEYVSRLIGPTVRSDPWLREEFSLYSNNKVLEALRLERKEPSGERAARQGENVRVSILFVTLVAVVFGPVLAFVISNPRPAGTFWTLLGEYTEFFSYGFGAYAFLLNSVYLALLVFGSIGVIRQDADRQDKPLSLLFYPGVLPAMSIIVPAYNEEVNIVENVRSLLDLRYPDYEVLVVNDGSRDRTLERLVEHFELERADVFLHGYLGTRPVRGVYRNPRVPGLLVIDKSNGGKADSLNAGINAARKEYFAAIDSDSILERDALLELAARFIDTDRPVVASGGNIMPVNGCTVDHGTVDEVRVSKKPLAAFQTMEYVRAFMTGRTGWAQMNALLIISGAFGVFRTSEVIASRGYLTSSERYTKDTVAEDMELVVRVTRDLRRSGIPHDIQYAANANCWTEVPETPRVLGAQRDRWQRGLIDILFFHFGMLLKPKYGRAGSIALPYYYVFELLGPWIELQGYILFVVALALGVLPAGLIWFVIAATIPLGMLTSLIAVMLVNWHTDTFGRREGIVLFLLALLENAGYRQYSNVLRIRGYVSSLGRRTGWGLMKRRGFASRR